MAGVFCLADLGTFHGLLGGCISLVRVVREEWVFDWSGLVG